MKSMRYLYLYINKPELTDWHINIQTQVIIPKILKISECVHFTRMHIKTDGLWEIYTKKIEIRQIISYNVYFYNIAGIKIGKGFLTAQPELYVDFLLRYIYYI